MASSVPFRRIELDEAEVPGAELSRPISENKVSDLRRFLVTRGVKLAKNLKKEALVELCNNTLKRKIPIDEGVDGGKCLTKRAARERAADLQTAAEGNHDGTVNLFPIGGWKQFPSYEIPTFSLQNIEDHFINSAFIENLDCCENEELEVVRFDTKKPLARGRKYLASGHIPKDKMFDAVTARNKNYCLKAKVTASMENKVHCVMAMLGSSGTVLDATCDCKASAMGRCSHVAGLLFALEDYVRTFGNQPVACTSRLCAWNQGRQQKTSNPIFMNQYTDKRDPGRIICFNPFNERSEASKNPQHHALRVCLENPGPAVGWQFLLSFVYEDYQVTDMRKEELAVNVLQLQKALLFGFNQPGEVPGTIQQSKSSSWQQLRHLLITASTVDYFLAARSDTIQRKIHGHMWFPKHVSTLAMDYGIKNEPKARAAYVKATGNGVNECGLWVNPEYPGLGASPDGIIVCSQTNSKGILEIKCPFLLRDHSPSEFDSKLTRKQMSGYFLQRVNGEVTLKKNHKYFRQIQMQMAIVGLKWCDFIVWSVKGMVVQRIAFDENIWNPLCEKLSEVHSNYMCPEYFEMRIPRRLEPFYLSQNRE